MKEIEMKNSKATPLGDESNFVEFAASGQNQNHHGRIRGHAVAYKSDESPALVDSCSVPEIVRQDAPTRTHRKAAKPESFNKTRNLAMPAGSATISSSKKTKLNRRIKATSKRHPSAQRVSARAYRDRVRKFEKSVCLAQKMGLDLQTTATITWWSLCECGELNEGHILGFPERDRCQKLIARLRRVSQQLGFKFVCIWSRSVGPRNGAHMHILFHWPAQFEVSLVHIFTVMLGSRPVPWPTRWDDIAISDCRGWLLRRNVRGLEGALFFARYIAKQDRVRADLQVLEGRCFGVSQAIGISA